MTSAAVDFTHGAAGIRAANRAAPPATGCATTRWADGSGCATGGYASIRARNASGRGEPPGPAVCLSGTARKIGLKGVSFDFPFAMVFFS